jgi:aryl-alcohol dehydrogenase-like predicted oxidoreductase
VERRRLGQLEVSRLCLGTDNLPMLDGDVADAIIATALDAGVNFFNAGGGHEQLAHAIGGRRDEVVIAAAFAPPLIPAPGDPAAEIVESCEHILRALDTDRIDLFQIHHPYPGVPEEEILRGFDRLIRDGKVRHIGSANYPGWQIADAEWVARASGLTAFVSAQNSYSILDREIERDVIPACRHFGLAVLPYFPLASGMLTGKYRRGSSPGDGTRFASIGFLADWFLTDEHFDVVERLELVAAERGVSLLQLALGGLAAQPEVAAVLTGATSPEHVLKNVAAISWVPDVEDLAAIDAASPPKQIFWDAMTTHGIRWMTQGSTGGA